MEINGIEQIGAPKPEIIELCIALNLCASTTIKIPAPNKKNSLCAFVSFCGIVGTNMQISSRTSAVEFYTNFIL